MSEIFAIDRLNSQGKKILERPLIEDLTDTPLTTPNPPIRAGMTQPKTEIKSQADAAQTQKETAEGTQKVMEMHKAMAAVAQSLISKVDQFKKTPGMEYGYPNLLADILNWSNRIAGDYSTANSPIAVERIYAEILQRMGEMGGNTVGLAVNNTPANTGYDNDLLQRLIRSWHDLEVPLATRRQKSQHAAPGTSSNPNDDLLATNPWLIGRWTLPTADPNGYRYAAMVIQAEQARRAGKR
jgi:hypothetical protein